jgi:4-amino-4-deoxy-L-arabinose transferase-like glycosyltransferase
MAYHQFQGWKYLELWRTGGFFSQFAAASPQYPPLYYLVEATVLGCLGWTQYLAFLSNLPALVLLGYSAFWMAGEYLPERMTWKAGLLPLLLPTVAWVSRESLLDVLLAGFVTAGGALILKSNFFARRNWTLLFGVVCGLGVLTKWTFPIYLAFPVLYALMTSRYRRRSFENIALATVVGLVIVSPYYLPNMAALVSRYPTTEQAGLIPWEPYPRHGEPGLNNVLGWIYYPRVFASYFLGILLTLFLVVGVLRRQVREQAQMSGLRFLAVWFVGAALLLTFVSPKDPRFALPLVAPLSLLLLAVWREKKSVLRTILVVAALQFLLVSFPILPSLKLALFEREGDQDFQTLQTEWVLFQTDYFDVAGRPRQEDWRFLQILGHVEDGSRMGFLPDLPRFHPEGMRLAAAQEGRSISVVRFGNSSNWEESLPRLDYVLAKDGHQGISFITGYNLAVVDFVTQNGWLPVASWELPDESKATLWKKP